MPLLASLTIWYHWILVIFQLFMWAHESTNILDHFLLELHQNTHRQWCGILASFARLHLNTFGNDCCSRFAPDVSNGVRSMLRFLAGFIQPIQIFPYPLIVHIVLSVATFWAAKYCPPPFSRVENLNVIIHRFKISFGISLSSQFAIQPSRHEICPKFYTAGFSG